MADWTVNLLPFSSDNYAYLIEGDKGLAVIDPGDAAPVLKAMEVLAMPLEQILITHHHSDHVGGVNELVAASGAEVIGPRYSQDKELAAQGIKLDHAIADNDEIECLGAAMTALHTPGHTLDHLSFYTAGHQAVFSADCLFVLGCGRMFEGDAPTFWNSLAKLRELPDETMVFCGHEYTLANAKFTEAVSPASQALSAEINRMKSLRGQGQPTVPSTIGDQERFNPFMRCDDLEFAEHLGIAGASPEAIFAELRKRKDSF